jgi:ATP-dependent RNA helicase DHX29
MLPSPFPQPEMLRVALSETALQIKKLELGPVAYVLSRAPDPPAVEAVRDALKTLTEAGALDAEGALTPLGHHLARLPVDVRAGKIIVLGAVLGCLRPSLTIAAYLSSKSPFVAPHEERDAADRVRYAMAASGAPGIAAGQRSDHLVVVAAYDGWRAACASGGARAGADYCRRHCLCPVTLAAMHGTAAGRSLLVTSWRVLSPRLFVSAPRAVYRHAQPVRGAACGSWLPWERCVCCAVAYSSAA